MILVDVDNRVRLVGSEALPDEVKKELRDEFTYANPKHATMRFIGRGAWGVPKEIKTWTERRGALDFPRGGLKRVLDVLRQHGIQFACRDLRASGDLDAGVSIPDHLLDLRPYQREGADMLVAKENGLLRAKTGSGKTCTAIEVVSKIKTPTLIVVRSGGLFDQWMRRAGRELGLAERELGQIRGSKCKLAPVTIAMQQSVSNKLDARMLAYFGGVIVDEVHTAAAQSLYELVDRIPARYRIGVSDDERRKDRLEFLIYDLFGRVVHEPSKEMLLAEGHVLEVETYVIPTDFRADWYGVADKGGFADEDPPEPKEVDVVRLHEEMMGDPGRRALVRDALLEFASNDYVCAVFSHRREHCTEMDRFLVERGVRTGFLLGGPENRREYRQTIERLESGEARVGVGTYQAFGTGIDLPALEVGICALPIAANKQFVGQVRGRLCRPGREGKAPRLIYLWDRHVFGAKHLRNLAMHKARVFVRSDDGAWVPSKEYLRQLRLD